MGANDLLFSLTGADLQATTDQSFTKVGSFTDRHPNPLAHDRLNRSLHRDLRHLRVRARLKVLK